MEICYETARESVEPGSAPANDRWSELRQRLELLRESVDSEWAAVGQALTGTTPVRKWLGWALYRVAARVNPEIHERDH